MPALPGPLCPHQEGWPPALGTLQDVARDAEAGACKRQRSGCKGTRTEETVLCQRCSKPVAQTRPSWGARCTGLHY